VKGFLVESKRDGRRAGYFEFRRLASLCGVLLIPPQRGRDKLLVDQAHMRGDTRQPSGKARPGLHLAADLPGTVSRRNKVEATAKSRP